MSTHILLVYKDQNSDILFRADDGIAIAQRKKTVIVYGEDCNKKQSRVFIDDEHARKYIRETLPAQDLKQQTRFENGLEGAPEDVVSVEERDATPLIVLPEDSMELPGGMRNFN